MDREVKQTDGHYQLPLSSKNPKLELSNNWMMVERRINQLERKFRRDDSYFQYYKTFMDDMLAKRGVLRNQHHLLHWERLGIYFIMLSSIPTILAKSEWYLTVQQKLVGNQ